jgi:hypothetical protein
MTVLFFIPMMVIAFYESTLWKKSWLDDFIDATPLDADDSPAARDPVVDGEDARNGIAISKVPFSELVKTFPNTHEVSPNVRIPRTKSDIIIILQSGEAIIMEEIHELKTRLDVLIRSLDEKKT